jgi:hypothetical protein
MVAPARKQGPQGDADQGHEDIEARLVAHVRRPVPIA